MDVLAELALSALDVAVVGLLPGTVPAGLQRAVRVLPVEIRPVGLGGYIGTHPEPQGAIRARHIEARLEIDISGGQDTAALAHLNQVTRSLLAQDRNELRRQGIYHLSLKTDTSAPRSAQFDLRYEYLHLPTASEEIIATVDLNLNVTPI